MTDAEKLSFKEVLKSRASDILHERINASTRAMNEAQSAAAEEGKSSVGDKYETSRAMAQIDRDIHAKQLESAQKELTLVQQTDVGRLCMQVEKGAFVETDNGNFFLLAGLGGVDDQNEKIYFLSIQSPLGKVLSGKKTNNTAVFNNKAIKILNLF
jgi:transcription elongation GreA/GreB family factor